MTKCIILICGPPACLKSTLIQILQLIVQHRSPSNIQLRSLCVKKLKETLSISHLSCSFLRFDDLFAGYESEIITNESNWKQYRSFIADQLEGRILSQAEARPSSTLTYASQILDRLEPALLNLTEKRILVIEDNFYYSSMRHRYRQIAQRAQIGFAAIHLHSTLSVALQRNQRRHPTQRVTDLSLEHIYAKYEHSPEDLRVDTTERGLTISHLRRVLRRIEQACDEPEPLPSSIVDEEQRRRATEINQTNLTYQLDQRLRKFISTHLNDEFSRNAKFQKTREKKLYAERINEQRQRFLEMIKHGHLQCHDSENIEEMFKQFFEQNHRAD